MADFKHIITVPMLTGAFLSKLGNTLKNVLAQPDVATEVARIVLDVADDIRRHLNREMLFISYQVQMFDEYDWEKQPDGTYYCYPPDHWPVVDVDEHTEFTLVDGGKILQADNPYIGSASMWCGYYHVQVTNPTTDLANFKDANPDGEYAFSKLQTMPPCYPGLFRTVAINLAMHQVYTQVNGFAGMLSKRINVGGAEIFVERQDPLYVKRQLERLNKYKRRKL